MMRHVKYAAAVAALLFLGAGCAAGRNTTAEVAPTPSTRVMEKKPVMNVRAEGTVEGTVDGILKDADSEQATQKEAEGDAAEVDSDKAQLNAYGDSSYDVK